MAKSSIGEFLSVQRKAKGMTQEEVAERLGVSAKTVSSWENDRTYPDIMLLPAIADLYGVSVDELIRGERDTRGENAAQTKELSDAALIKMRKHKLAQFTRKRGIFTAMIVVGAFFALLMFCISAVWAVVMGIVGILAFVSGTVLLWYHTKAYLSSEGIAFPDDITEENSQFYLSVMHESIIRQNHGLIPLFLPGLIILINFIGAYTTGFFIGLCLFAVPLSVIAAMLIWQRSMVSRYGSEEQKSCKNRNIKLLSVFAGILVITVLLSDFLFFGVFFGARNSKVKSADGLEFDTAQEFISHLETLRIVEDDLNDIPTLSYGDTFTCDLSEAKADIKAIRENGNPNNKVISKKYDIGNGFVLEYFNYKNSESFYISFKMSDGTDGNVDMTLLRQVKEVKVYKEDGTTEAAFDLYYPKYNYIRSDKKTFIYANGFEEDGLNKLGFDENEILEDPYYQTDSFLFVVVYKKTRYEFHDGKYGVFVYTHYEISESKLHLYMTCAVITAEFIIYLFIRKKYRFLPIRKTF